MCFASELVPTLIMWGCVVLACALVQSLVETRFVMREDLVCSGTESCTGIVECATLQRLGKETLLLEIR